MGKRKMAAVFEVCVTSAPTKSTLDLPLSLGKQI